MRRALLVVLVLFAAWFTIEFIRGVTRMGSWRPRPIESLTGFVTVFFDTFCIGSFATTTAVFLADTVIARLTAAWRELLTAHEPNHRGRCRACAPRWTLRRAECTVWRTAHRHLVVVIPTRAAPGRPESGPPRNSADPAR